MKWVVHKEKIIRGVKIMSSAENKKWFVDDLERFVFTKLWSGYQNSPNTRWVDFYKGENEERPPLDLLVMTLKDLENQGIVEFRVGDRLWEGKKGMFCEARLTNKGVKFIEELFQERYIGFQ